MELEGYFDFQAPNAIRVKGTRIDIKTVLQDYSAGASPEEIVLRYPTLSLEQVHATITYYLRHRDETERYLSQSVAEGEAAWAAQETSEFVSELRRRLDEQRRLLQVGGGQRG